MSPVPRSRPVGTAAPPLPGGGLLLVLLLLAASITPGAAAVARSPGEGTERGSPPLSVPSPGPSRASCAGPCPSAAAPVGAVDWANVSTPTSEEAPAPRCCSMMAFDPRDGYMVFFGGAGDCASSCNQTWAFRNDTWYPLHPAEEPPAREWGMMAYDPFDGYVLLFGGLSLTSGAPLSDTWEYLGGTWTELSAASPVPPRWAAGLAPDPTLGEMVLFGGYNPVSGFLSDTWTYFGGIWTAVPTAVSPPARWTPGIAYDPELGGVLMFGGYSPTAGFLSDTWVFQHAEWYPIATTSAPSGREKAMMDYDAADQAVVLFGGQTCPLGCSSSLPVRTFNDTWTFQNDQWTNRTTSPAPPALCCEAMSYDWDEGRMVLVADAPGNGNASAVWELALATPPKLGPEVVGMLNVPVGPTTENLTTILVEAVPAEGELSYRYSGLPSGCFSQEGPFVVCHLVVPGTYEVNVTLGDATGLNASGTIEFQVVQATAAPPPTYPSPYADAQTWGTEAAVGGAIFLVALYLYLRRPPPAAAPVPPAESPGAKPSSPAPARSPSPPPPQAPGVPDGTGSAGST